jgi:hypothetical protein
MAEPQTSVTAVVAALVAPLFGQYAVIIFAALAGGLWPLSAAATQTRTQGALLLLRLILTATVLTGLIAWGLEQKTGFPASKALGPVAFLIAAMGNRWGDVFDKIASRIGSIISGGA